MEKQWKALRTSVHCLQKFHPKSPESDMLS